jgi:hypothetical protein
VLGRVEVVGECLGADVVDHLFRRHALGGERADQRPRRIDELVAPAVAERDVERQPLVPGRLRLDGRDRLTEPLREPLEPPKDTDSHPGRLPARPLHERDELVRDDLVEGGELGLRAGEVFVRERPHGDLADAKLGTPGEQLVDLVCPAAVPGAGLG